MPEILAELVDPVFALVVGGHEGHGPKGVEVAHLVDIDGAVQSAAPLGVGADDVSRLQTGDVERLRGRVQDDAVLPARLADGGKRLERVAWHHELTVYLVRDHLHAVAKADVIHPLELLPRPYASRRVVGVAEQEDGGLLVGTLRFEVGPVDSPPPCPSRGEGSKVTFSHRTLPTFSRRTMVTFNRRTLPTFSRRAILSPLPSGGAGGGPQHRLRHLATIIYNRGEEAVIVRREDEHPLAGHRQRLDGHRHGGHDARRIENLLAADGPPVAPPEPPNDGVVILIAHDRIAEDGVLGAPPDGLLDGRCDGEVHVGHPQRHDVLHLLRGEALRHLVPLDAARAAPSDVLIEIVFLHICFLL